MKSISCVWLFVTLWTVAHQAPQSMGFSRQEYWSELPFPSPGDLPDPGIELRSPALQANALTSEPREKSINVSPNPPRLGHTGFEGPEPTGALLAWQSNKTILLYFTQNSASGIWFSSSAGQVFRSLTNLCLQHYSPLSKKIFLDLSPEHLPVLCCLIPSSSSLFFSFFIF